MQYRPAPASGIPVAHPQLAGADGLIHHGRTARQGKRILTTEWCLQVDIVDGGWHWRWRCIGAQRGRWRLPRWLLPRSEAFKRVEGGHYRFSVSFALPLLGEVPRYGGLLHAVTD